MATPQTPQGFIAWMREIDAKFSRIHERLNNVLANTGLSIPGPGVTQVDGNLVILGNLTALGKVTNDALTNPVVPQVVLQQATNYSVAAGSLNTIVSQSVTVPANCTQLLAHSLVFSFVVNPNTTGGSNGSGGDVHELKAYIGGSGGQTTGVSISGSNGQTSVSAGAAVLLTGLTPGATVTLEARAGNGYQAFAANGSNVASITATLMWLR